MFEKMYQVRRRAEENAEVLAEHGVLVNKIIDCGAEGCVYETVFPDAVAKITRSHSEMECYRIAQETESPIFPCIYEIFEFAPQFYCIIREAVRPLKNILDDDLYNELHTASRYLDFAGNFTHKPVFEYDIIKDFVKEGEDLQSRGYYIMDINGKNVGISEVNGRVVVFDGICGERA